MVPKLRVLIKAIELSNSILIARIDEMGAELKSLKENSTDTEYIWQSDPEWWTGAAPILFPIVGGLKDNTYTFKGKKYAMPQQDDYCFRQLSFRACRGI